MKSKYKYYLFIAAIMLLVSCKERTENLSQDDSTTEETDSLPVERKETLLNLTEDTVLSLYPELIPLLDTLYQHIYEKGFPAPAKEEVVWMEKYCTQLCAYYDRYNMGRKTLPKHVKADKVLNLADELYSGQEEETDMGKLVCNDIRCTFDRFRLYSSFSQLLEYCKDSVIMEELYAEYELADSIHRHIVRKIMGTVNDMLYGAAFYSTVYTTQIAEQLLEKRQNMYQVQTGIMKNSKRRKNRVNPQKAINLLIDTCEKQLTKCKTEDDDNSNNPDSVYWEKVFNDTNEAILQLRPLLNEWVDIWLKLDEELMVGSKRHSLDYSASYMLIDWKNSIELDK